MQITVATWNVHKCIGGVDRRYKPERVIETLKAHQPDVVLLQEVDEGAKRSQRHRQVDLLGDALELPHRCYGITHRLRSEGHYGNAILSRWPLIREHHIDLTIGRRKKRGAVFATVEVQTARGPCEVGVYCLHLGLAGTERRQQLLRFLDAHPFASHGPDVPVVLGGDFNDVWGSLGPRLLEPAGFRRAGDMANTFPAVAPVRPLDAIYVRGKVMAESCAPDRSQLGRRASDHLPLIAALTLGAHPGG